MKLVALGALSLLSLVGCVQGQPRLYRVALDETPVRTVNTPTCFRNSELPSNRNNTTEQNYRSEDEWVIWSGTEQTEYLDLGNQSWTLGDAPTIIVSDLIEGTDKTFNASRNVQTPKTDQFLELRQTTVSVKFNDFSAVPIGTVSLNSQFASQKVRGDCPTGMNLATDAASCTANLNFVARRIDVQQLTAYNNNP